MSAQTVLAYVGPAKTLRHELRKSAFKHGALALADEINRSIVQRSLARESRRARTMRILEVRDLRDGGIA